MISRLFFLSFYDLARTLMNVVRANNSRPLTLPEFEHLGFDSKHVRKSLVPVKCLVAELRFWSDI